VSERCSFLDRPILPGKLQHSQGRAGIPGDTLFGQAPDGSQRIIETLLLRAGDKGAKAPPEPARAAGAGVRPPAQEASGVDGIR